MSPQAAHTHWWQPFEAVVGIRCLLALALQFVLPLSFGDGIIALLRVLAGSVFVVIGLLVVGATRHQFRSYNQPTDPGQPTSTLITPLRNGGFLSTLAAPLATGELRSLAVQRFGR